MIKVENLYKTFKTTSEEKSLFGKKKIDFHAVKNLNSHRKRFDWNSRSQWLW